MYHLWLDIVAGCVPWQDWFHWLVSAISRGCKLDSVIVPGKVGALAELPKCTVPLTRLYVQAGPQAGLCKQVGCYPCSAVDQVTGQALWSGKASSCVPQLDGTGNCAPKSGGVTVQDPWSAGTAS